MTEASDPDVQTLVVITPNSRIGSVMAEALRRGGVSEIENDVTRYLPDISAVTVKLPVFEIELFRNALNKLFDGFGFVRAIPSCTDIPTFSLPMPTGDEKYCSFCGKERREVRQLVAGPAVFICNECVDLSVDILKETGAS